MPQPKLSKIEEFLRGRGQKVTTRRRQIIKEILGIQRHFRAEDLYERLLGTKNPPSKATLYRLLALLVEGDFLETHQFGDRFLYYEIAMDREHHDHMMCLECGRIDEFANKELELLQQRILERRGFKMLYHSHKLYGVCKACQKRGKSRGGKAPARGKR